LVGFRRFFDISTPHAGLDFSIGRKGGAIP
jgi:hypothetical protein